VRSLQKSRTRRNLYLSNRGHDSLMVADVGEDGSVTARGWVPSGGKWPWFFTLTTDNRMLVANNLSDDIAIFDVDAAGDLHLAVQLTVPRPAFITPWPSRGSA